MWAMRSSGGSRLYYECTLQRVLSSGRDVVIMLGIEEGQVRQHALKVAGEPYAVCTMKEHGLKVDGHRLSGPMQIQVGPSTEKIELDVALDKGGTYSIAYGCPGPARQAEGNVSVEAPRDAASKRWVLWLQGTFGSDTSLGMPFEVERQTRTLTAQPAMAVGYNRGRHPVDASRLAFDGTNLDGEVGITLVSFQASKWLDAMVPAHRQSVEGVIKVKATLDGKDRGGSCSAVLGIEKHRQGIEGHTGLERAGA